MRSKSKSEMKGSEKRKVGPKIATRNSSPRTNLHGWLISAKIERVSSEKKGSKKKKKKKKKGNACAALPCPHNEIAIVG